MNEGQTHWRGCWAERGHQGCAVAEIERLTAEKEAWDGHKVCELLRDDVASLLTDNERLQARADKLEKINYNLTRDNIEQANKLFGAEQRIKALEGENRE